MSGETAVIGEEDGTGEKHRKHCLTVPFEHRPYGPSLREPKSTF